MMVQALLSLVIPGARESGHKHPRGCVTVLGDLLHLIGRYGYLVVFFGVMLESVGVPLPGETILIAAGALVHKGALDFGDTLFLGIFGAVVGDQIGYWVGRFEVAHSCCGGRYAFITPERLGHAEAFFAQHGGRAVFLARFITGLRVFALVAGTSRMPWGKFVLYNVLGGTMWATVAVSLGYFLWASISLVEHWVGRASLLLVAALAPRLAAALAYPRAARGDNLAAVRAAAKTGCREGYAGSRLRCGTSGWSNVRKWVRGVLLVGSVGLALHLVFPQIPRLERSLRLVAGTSHPLVGAAFLAEL